MALLLYLIYIFLILFILYWIIQVPIRIAKSRGVSGSELTTISILSWCGILFVGFTWFIAIVLALIWQPKDWIDKSKAIPEKEKNANKLDSLEMLEKLGNLKEKGIITEQEFKKEKNKIMKNIT